MRIGILGNGQLSRMLALAGIPLGINFVFLGPNKKHCVQGLGKTIIANYNDHNALTEFTQLVDVVTYENENIPYQALEIIGKSLLIYPQISALCVMQDRLYEKMLFTRLNIPTNSYREISDKNSLTDALHDIGYPAILKKRKFCYDGKGQLIIHNAKFLKNVTDELCAGSILESYVSYDREISIIAARDINGIIKCYDISQNYHIDGILQYSNNIINDVKHATAISYIKKILLHFNYVGVCSLELFQKAGQLIANELAPRVHNSGHWTIEAAVTSQFENHLRCILGYSVGETKSIAQAAMYNILGCYPDVSAVLKVLNIHYHTYEKVERPNRKLGHITICPFEKDINNIEHIFMSRT